MASGRCWRDCPTGPSSSSTGSWARPARTPVARERDRLGAGRSSCTCRSGSPSPARPAAARSARPWPPRAPSSAPAAGRATGSPHAYDLPAARLHVVSAGATRFPARRGARLPRAPGCCPSVRSRRSRATTSSSRRSPSWPTCRGPGAWWAPRSTPRTRPGCGPPSATAGLDDRVTLAGVLTGPASRRRTPRADLLVLPSRHETYGIVASEALARGIPVLATDVGGVREALGATSRGAAPGLLVPPADPVVARGVAAGLADDAHAPRSIAARRRRASYLPGGLGRRRGGGGEGADGVAWVGAWLLPERRASGVHAVVGERRREERPEHAAERDAGRAGARGHVDGRLDRLLPGRVDPPAQCAVAPDAERRGRDGRVVDPASMPDVRRWRRGRWR